MEPIDAVLLGFAVTAILHTLAYILVFVLTGGFKR